MTKKEELR